MSLTSTFAVGLGSGLALWHLTKRVPPPAPSSVALAALVPRNCVVRIAASGIFIDDAPVDLAEAVRRCQSTDRAVVSVDPGAPASSCMALMTALQPTHRPMTRNAAVRNTAETRTAFTLVTYAKGRAAGPTTRYFESDSPITWTEARDRLAGAGVLDLALAGRTYQPGGWMLSIDPLEFRARRAEPMPGRRNAEASSTFTLVVHPRGLGDVKRLRWFRAAPTTWEDARDRLAAVGFLDKRMIAPRDPGYWQLVTDPSVFNAERAETLPGGPRRRGADRAKRFTNQGRTILRDDEPILYLDRVDLGDARYAMSPHHADLLVQRIVRLLNQHGAR